MKKERKNSESNLIQFGKLLLITTAMLWGVSLNGSCRTPVRIESNYQMEGVKYKPATLMGQENSAFTHWLRRNDQVEVVWTNFFFLATPPDGNTDDLPCDSFSIEDCPDRVDLCQDHNIHFFGGGIHDIVVDLDFIRSEMPKIIKTIEPIASGCLNRDVTRPIFQIENSGIYRFAKEFPVKANHMGETDGEIKVHALDSDENRSQVVAFDLKKERIDSLDYWIWRMPDTEVWSDNFSKNVRISRLRVLDGDREVRPSRSIYLPNFQSRVSGHGQEQSNTCFVNPNTPNDDSISLSECRKTPTANSGVQDNITTPVFIQSQPNDLLTWFIEFNTNQGAEDPTNLSALKIEFTIEAVN